MSFTPGTDEGNVRTRLEELETRLAYLESVVLDEVDDTGRAEFALAEVAPVDVALAEVAPAESTPAEVVPTSQTAPEPETAPEPTWPRTIPSERGPATPHVDVSYIEEHLAGRALALVGGAALILGAVFFLSLAFSRGWIGPEAQVPLGLIGGSLSLGLGAFLLTRGERIVGHVLTAVGLAVISLSLFAATSLYELIEPPLALLGVFAAGALTTLLAVRARSQVMAGFGLVAVIAAPPIMGAAADLLTVAYMAVALAGIAAVSLWQTWPWLPPVAFLLSVPQLYQWIATGPDELVGIPALLVYWALMTVAAGGEAFRSRGQGLSVTSAPLLLAVGAAVIGLGFMVLPADEGRAAFLLVLALLHGLVAVTFVPRRGSLHPFALLAGGYGLAMASAAVPLLLDAPATAVVWTAEASALTYLAGRRAHGPALLSSIVLFAIAAASVAYQALLHGPVGDFLELGQASGSVEGVVAAVAFFLLAAAVSAGVVPERSFRVLLVGMAGFVALPVVPLLFDGAAVVAAWMVLATLALGIPRWLVALPQRRLRWLLGPALDRIRPRQDLTSVARLVPLAVVVIATGFAQLLTAAFVVDQGRLPEVPFSDTAGVAALALAAGFVALGLVARGADGLRRSLFAAGLVIGIVAITEIAPPWYVLVWAGLATGAALMSRIEAGGVVSYLRMSLGALAMLAVLAMAEAPPHRLEVGAGGVPPHPLLVSDASLALGTLAAAFAVVAIIGRAHWVRMAVTGLVALAGLTTLYLLSVGAVDVFAGEAFGLPTRSWVRLDELAKEAQVSLSILWTTVGVVVLGGGLLLRQAELRLAGLVVLGLATVKVFLIDLSSLDVAYRVITLIVLGLLLIVSAYAWGRLKPADSNGRASRGDGIDTTSGDVHARP